MFFLYFLISVFCSLGLSIVFVEKRYEWPVRLFNVFVRWKLRKIDKRLKGLASCTVCCSFWATLFVDFFLLFVSGGSYFLWPLSGFAVSGLAWFIYELLNVLDRKED